MNFINFEDINEIHIELSSDCKLHCLHCSSSEIINKKNGSYDLNKLEEFLSFFNPNNCHIYITGGEPLLSEKIFDFIKLCKAMGFSVGIFTTFNTNLDVEEMLFKLSQEKLDDFYVSLYDSVPELHDYITNVSGSYLNSIKAIISSNQYKISPKINFVLLKTNIERLNDILIELDKLNPDEIRLLKLVPHGNALSNWDKIGVGIDVQIQTIGQIFINQLKYKSKLTFSGFPKIVKCRPFNGLHNCGANKTLLYVDSYGDIYPCASQKNKPSRKIGSIFDPLHIKKLVCDNNCYSDSY